MSVIPILEAQQCTLLKANDALLMSVLLSIEQPLQVFDAEAYHNGTVNGGEGLAVEPADILAEPCFVYRSDLFEQDGGFGFETVCRNCHMGRQSYFCLSACDCCHDSGGLCLLPVLFCKIKIGRIPPCSLPKPAPKSAE